MSFSQLRNSLLFNILFVIAVVLMDVSSSFAQGPIIVRENSLSALSLDEIGTLNAQNGGLGADLWQQLPRHYVEQLIVYLPEQVKSNTARDLKKRLLLSVAVPPHEQSDEAADLFILRLKQLAKTGAYEEIYEMVEQVPTNMRSEEMVRIIIAARLIAGEVELACSAIRANLSNYTSVQWRKWVALCQASEGNKAAASLTVKLLKEADAELDEDFDAHIGQLLAPDEKRQKAIEAWQKKINISVLSLPEIDLFIPSQKFLDADLLFNAKLAAWWAKIDDESAKARAEALIHNYAILDGLGDNIKTEDWLDLGLYNLHRVEGAAVHAQLSQLFDVLTKRKRKGAVIAMLVMLLADIPASDLPTSLLHQLLKSLAEFGLEEEAKLLAEEALQ